MKQPEIEVKCYDKRFDFSPGSAFRIDITIDQDVPMPRADSDVRIFVNGVWVF